MNVNATDFRTGSATALVPIALPEGWDPLLACLGYDRRHRLRTTEGASALRFAISDASVPNGDLVRQEGPRGLTVDRIAEDAEVSGRYRLNHVAYDVADLEESVEWFSKILGGQVILQRGRTWDPVYEEYWADCHIFQEPGLYLTLRERGQVRLDHWGWMTDERTSVDDACKMVRQLGWLVVFGPEDIDGSYLFHFRGPQGRVHDVFSPSPDLRRGVWSS